MGKVIATVKEQTIRQQFSRLADAVAAAAAASTITSVCATYPSVTVA